MSFEIDTRNGVHVLMADGAEFIDTDGHRYAGCFDGRNVMFSDGEINFTGRWLSGTSAIQIRRTLHLCAGFAFTFFDHGHSPQRLHALWQFAGTCSQAIEGWKQAGFSVSIFDRWLNQNHPRSSIHLRTKGARVTGADSSHVVIFPGASGHSAMGQIHVGEFNPFTGWGVGFLLHQLEARSSERLSC